MTDDREAFEKARQIGLERRQEQRLARATYTAAEVKVLTETATKVAYTLGRKDAGEEVAEEFARRAKLAARIPDGERSGVREGMIVTWITAEELARSMASQPAQDASEPRTDPPAPSDLPPEPQAVRSPQEDA